MSKNIYTEPELNKLCKKYQKLLRLQDWDIVVVFVDQMTMSDREAQVTYKLANKIATISIPTPETFASAVSADQDMKQCLLHELIHLHFSFAHFKDVEYHLFELGINRLADALAKLLDD